MSHIVEKDWITKAGLRAVVLFVHDSHRCGYVDVGEESDLLGKTYNDLYEAGITIDVHGGLTYSDQSTTYPAKGGAWWFGFDCAHSGDATKYFAGPDDVMRSLEYCISECENMAEQLAKAKYETADSKIAKLEQQRDELVAALNEIASWGEGEEVNSGFDEYHSAKAARAALAKIGLTKAGVK